MQNLSHLLTLINLLLATLFTLLFALWQELRNARRARGWTIEKAAEIVGVDTSTYHRWELGYQRPHPVNLLRLSQVFTIDIGYDFTPASTSLKANTACPTSKSCMLEQGRRSTPYPNNQKNWRNTRRKH
jgi:transcriptional regulator with XRE-family HTH domain